MRLKNLIKAFLKKISKKHDKQIITDTAYLDKWERLKRSPDLYIGPIFIEGKIDDIAMALVHCDQKTKNRFLRLSKAFTRYKRLEEFIEKYSNISKEVSDKKKAYIANFSGLNREGYIQTTSYD